MGKKSKKIQMPAGTDSKAVVEKFCQEKNMHSEANILAVHSLLIQEAGSEEKLNDAVERLYERAQENKDVQESPYDHYTFSCVNCKSPHLRVAEKFRFRPIRCPNCHHVTVKRINTLIVDKDSTGLRGKILTRSVEDAKGALNCICTDNLAAVSLFLKLTSVSYHRLVVVVDPFIDDDKDKEALGQLLTERPELKHIQMLFLRIQVEYPRIRDLQTKYDPSDYRRRIRVANQDYLTTLGKESFLSFWDISRKERTSKTPQSEQKDEHPILFVLGVTTAELSEETPAPGGNNETETNNNEPSPSKEACENDFCTLCVIA